MPYPLPVFRDLVGGFQLCQEEPCHDLSGQVRGSELLPRVLGDLAPEVARPICALLPYDLCARGQLKILDEQRAALACGEVLGLVETVGAHLTDAAQRPAPVACQ